MKKILAYLFCLICVLIFSCIKAEKQEALQKEDIEKLLKRFYSNRFAIENIENINNKISINVIDTFIVVIVDERDTLFNNKYQEFHHYIAKDDSLDFIIRYKHDLKLPDHPKTDRKMKLSERKNVLAHISDNSGYLINACFVNYIGCLSDLNGNFIKKVNVNDSVYVYTEGNIIGPLIINEKKKASRKFIRPFSIENRYININEIVQRCNNVHNYIYFLLLEFIHFRHNIDVTGKNGLITFSPEKINKEIIESYSIIINYNNFVTMEIIDEIIEIGKLLGIKTIEKVKI